MSASSAPASTRRVAHGTLPVAAASVLVVAAASAGLLLGGSFGGSKAPAVRPPAATQSITHEGLRLKVPSGWARGDVATVPGFVRPLRLRNADDGLRASVERLPATSATLLPAAFVRSLESAPDRPAVVTLAGGRQAWRYRFPAEDGSMTLLYAAPTTSGIATVACTSPIDTSVPRACDALAAAVTVPGSRPLAPSTSAAFFTRLPAAVTELNSARSQGTQDLRAAKRSADQALAADGLARAHKAAGAALAPLTSAGDGLPSATVGAITATATAYTALASAARARLPKPYADAGRTVTGAEADLRQAMTKAGAAVEAASRTVTPVREPTASAATQTDTKPAAESTPAADRKPAADTKPAAANAPAAVGPAEGGPQGMDLTLIIIGLLCVIAAFLAVRGTVRQFR